MATMAEALQRSLLPERLPEIAGVESSGRYLAGPTDAQVGGDWYDLIELRNSLAGIAIGDVVGSGLDAAARMARLQNALRVYAVDGHRPSTALERMNGFARDAAGKPMATVFGGALTAVGVSTDVAVASVLANQLVASFIPALPGWFATNNLMNDGYL